MFVNDTLKTTTIELAVAAPGVIATASLSVDIASSLNISYTGAVNGALTLPAPTDVQAGDRLRVANTGAIAFIVGGIVVVPGFHTFAHWTGAAWSFPTPAVSEIPVCQLAFPTATTSIPFVRFYDAPGQGGGTLANVPPCSAVYSSFLPLNGLNHPAYDRRDYYSSRARGWLRPTISGTYTFHLSSDDFGSFAIGPANGNFAATLSAQISNAGYTGSPGTNGASFAINLVAGTAYPWEVLHSEGDGGDYWLVEWSGPVGARQLVPASVIFNDNPNAKVKRTLIKRTTGSVVQYFDSAGALVVPSVAEPIIDCNAALDYVCPPLTSAAYVGPVGYYNGFALPAVALDNFLVRYDNITNTLQMTTRVGTETIRYYTTRTRLAATINNAASSNLVLNAGVWVQIGNNLLTDGDFRELVFTPTGDGDGRAYKFEMSQWTTPTVKVVMSLGRWV